MIDGQSYPSNRNKLNSLLLSEPGLFEEHSEEFLEEAGFKDTLFLKNNRHLAELLNKSERQELLKYASDFTVSQINDILDSKSPKEFLKKSASKIAEFRRGEIRYVRDLTVGQIKRVTVFVGPCGKTQMNSISLI